MLGDRIFFETGSFASRRAYSLMANLIGKPAANLFMVDRTNFQEKLITAPVKNETDNSLTFAYIIRIYRERAPRSFEDARGFVINEYQNYLEEKWLETLKKKYPVKINEAVLGSMTNR